MIDTDKKRFAEILNEFGVIHHKPVTTDLAREYWAVLKDLRLDELEGAAISLKRNHGWFPKPSDFWRIAKTEGWS